MPLSLPKPIVAATLGLALALSAGCAPALSQLDAQFDKEAVRLRPLAAVASEGWAQASVDGLLVEARWLGRARPLATAYDPLGRVSRYVVPYTRKTWLIELRVHNGRPGPVTVKGDDWQLLAQPGAMRRTPLALDYFKAQWPTQAVRSEAMMLDQSLAIGQVIRTLWGERSIDPGETAIGILPFLEGPEAPVSARLQWRAEPAVTMTFEGEGR